MYYNIIIPSRWKRTLIILIPVTKTNHYSRDETKHSSLIYLQAPCLLYNSPSYSFFFFNTILILRRYSENYKRVLCRFAYRMAWYLACFFFSSRCSSLCTLPLWDWPAVDLSEDALVNSKVCERFTQKIQ